MYQLGRNCQMASDQIKKRILEWTNIVKDFLVTEKKYDWACLYAPKMDQNEPIQIEKFTANHLINSWFMMDIIYFWESDGVIRKSRIEIEWIIRSRPLRVEFVHPSDHSSPSTCQKLSWFVVEIGPWGPVQGGLVRIETISLSKTMLKRDGSDIQNNSELKWHLQAILTQNFWVDICIYLIHLILLNQP